MKWYRYTGDGIDKDLFREVSYNSLENVTKGWYRADNFFTYPKTKDFVEVKEMEGWTLEMYKLTQAL